ncbi:LexA family protein [Paralysiella testudinis]|uniref:LexA family protein n=1 Tax=Paralysiella testudinis TaxID=2809020 RepID=UPI001E4C70AD|nr:helix-turn-helix domain-containing protein [Paralysiella testudinis]
MQGTIGERIRQKRKELKLTQKELARRMKEVSHVAISQWESNTTKPNAENLYDLSILFGCDLSWLLKGEGQSSNVASINLNGNMVPIISYNILETWDIAQPLQMMKEEEHIMTDVNISVFAFAVRVLGDSMKPDFIEGDIVIIDPEIKPEPGEFVLARNQNNVLFRKYREDGSDLKGGSHFILTPLNKDYVQVVSRDQDVRIIGTMVEHRIYRRKR